MIARGEPIVYARTLNVDFQNRLLVSPKSFTTQQSENAYNLAKEATHFMEKVSPEGRFIGAKSGNIIILGKVIFINKLYKAIELEPKFDRVDDETKGRFAFAFTGAAFKAEDLNNFKEQVFPTDKALAKIYEESIKPLWNMKTPENAKSDPVDIELEPLKVSLYNVEMPEKKYSQTKEKNSTTTQATPSQNTTNNKQLYGQELLDHLASPNSNEKEPKTSKFNNISNGITSLANTITKSASEKNENLSQLKTQPTRKEKSFTDVINQTVAPSLPSRTKNNKSLIDLLNPKKKIKFLILLLTITLIIIYVVKKIYWNLN